MGLPCYMAMTNAEYISAQVLPSHPAWMACHFSSSGDGLSNFPQDFPTGGMIILNDSVPICGHDTTQILQELTGLYTRLRPAYFLLDFQRPNIIETAILSRTLCQSLSCPVGISHLYAAELDCPVLLPPPPPHRSLKEYLSPWKDREIWLELAPDTAKITITEDGAQIDCGVPICLEEPVFENQELSCRYHIQLKESSAVFHLQRNLQEFRKQAETLGVTCLVGLYQQLQ